MAAGGKNGILHIESGFETQKKAYHKGIFGDSKVI